MTKNFKLVLALILALMMVLGSMSALADPAATLPGSITIKSNKTLNVNGKTFNAYKILDATYANVSYEEAGETKTEKSIAYTVPSQMKAFYENYFTADGKTVTEQAATKGKTFDAVVIDKISALTNAADMQKFVKAALAAINAMDAADKAALLGGTSTVTAEAESTKIDNLKAGYYLIEDAGSAEPISSIMLDTVTDADVEIVIKGSIPKPVKKIVGTDENGNITVDDGTGNITSLVDYDQLGIGSTVNYVITQSVPNYTGYDNYYFIVNDKLSNGLTLNPESIEVYVDIDGDGAFEDTIDYTFTRNNVDNTTTEFKYTTEKMVANTDYYLYTQDTTKKAASGVTFEVAFADVMKFPVDADVRVTYSANLNKDAINGIKPNTNEVFIKYSNDPSKSGEGKPHEQQNKPGFPDDTTKHPIGDGPSDWTDTYTTKLVLTKTDNKGNKLEGVQFTLTGTSSEVVVKGEKTYEADPNGSFWMLKDGTYTDEAPTTKSYMSAAAAGATSGYVEASADDVTNKVTGIVYAAESNASGAAVKAYRPYKPGETGTVYILNLANDADYANTVTKYKEVEHTTAHAGETDVPVMMVGQTDANGVISFEELGAGTYTLSETKVPTGYNKAEDITFTIDWSIDTTKEGSENLTCTWSKNTTNAANKNDGNVTVTTDGVDAGTFAVTVVNNTGVELPSTGGIGTTIFYVAGSIMVLAAAILLITKRRMGAND